jgi:hypothetical protein
MTAENHGTGAPQGDDPFAYLYRQEGGPEGAAAPAQQPGVPRRSYNQVRAVGERQYGQQAAAPRPGAHGQQGGHGQGSPSAHYAAPETVPGGRAAARQHGGGHGGRGGGSHNGLLIGAVAVVAAVVIGIGTAMLFNGGDEEEPTGGSAGGTPTAPEEEQEKPGGQGGGEPEEIKLPKEDAAALRLSGSAHIEQTVPGAQGKGGSYVAGMNAAGAAAVWTTDVPEAGTYKLKVRYSVPGKDMKLSLGVNGKSHASGLNMKNFANAEEGDWAKGWTTTWATVPADKGTNRFVIACHQGDKCDVNLDQVWLEPAE